MYTPALRAVRLTWDPRDCDGSVTSRHALRSVNVSVDARVRSERKDAIDSITAHTNSVASEFGLTVSATDNVPWWDMNQMRRL